MKSLNDNFFKSLQISNLNTIFGGGATGHGMTCLMTEIRGHVIHDGDRSDPDQKPDE